MFHCTVAGTKPQEMDWTFLAVLSAGGSALTFVVCCLTCSARRRRARAKAAAEQNQQQANGQSNGHHHHGHHKKHSTSSGKHHHHRKSVDHMMDQSGGGGPPPPLGSGQATAPLQLGPNTLPTSTPLTRHPPQPPTMLQVGSGMPTIMGLGMGPVGIGPMAPHGLGPPTHMTSGQGVILGPGQPPPTHMGTFISPPPQQMPHPDQYRPTSGGGVMMVGQVGPGGGGHMTTRTKTPPFHEMSPPLHYLTMNDSC